MSKKNVNHSNKCASALIEEGGIGVGELGNWGM